MEKKSKREGPEGKMRFLLLPTARPMDSDVYICPCTGTYCGEHCTTQECDDINCHTQTCDTQCVGAECTTHNSCSTAALCPGLSVTP